MEIKVGMQGIVEDIVETSDTAAEVGSGSLLVYATPCMVAMMEGAACEAIDPVMPEGYTSVGIELNIQHLSATPVGMEIRAELERRIGKPVYYLLANPIGGWYELEKNNQKLEVCPKCGGGLEDIENTCADKVCRKCRLAFVDPEE